MGDATLPPWLGVWACLAPLLDDHLGAWLPMPASDPMGFLHWAAPLAAVLWAAIALCWRRAARCDDEASRRSEEHTSELQSLMRIPYAVFCLKKKNKHNKTHE